jgi:hypothetical protein
VVERLGHAVEHQADAHACGEHHRDPRDHGVLGLFRVFPQRNVSEAADRQPQDVDHEQGGEANEQPAGVFHDPVKDHLGSSGQVLPAGKAPDYKCQREQSGDAEDYLVDASLPEQPAAAPRFFVF